MSTEEQDLETTAGTSETPGEEDGSSKHRLALDVQISDVGPCRKHLKIAIPRSDIEWQFNESLGELSREAAVPGFRPGRAPKQLIQKRYRKEVAGQVKSALLLACLEQLDEDYKLNPISQPDLDIEAIELPEDGPMRFEMDVEVQPEFTLPDYKSLTVKRPVKTITDADVDAQFQAFLERYGQIVPKLEGGAETGDYITADIRFHRGDTTLSEVKEIQFRLQPELRFQDGHVPKLAEVLQGVRPGEHRRAEAVLGSGSSDPALRGQTVEVTFHVLDLKMLRLPDVDATFLRGVGFDSQDQLRQLLREVLERRLEYNQRQAVRRSVMDRLIDQTPFDLPADLVARQEQATLRRRFMELQQAGLSDQEIRAREAEIRANAHEATLRSLKESFILARIAEVEQVKVEDEDLAQEYEAIAARSDESARRVRSRIEKDGLTDAVASQILERKALDRILEYVTYEEVPMVEEPLVETLDQMATPAVAASASAEDEPTPSPEAAASEGEPPHRESSG